MADEEAESFECDECGMTWKSEEDAEFCCPECHLCGSKSCGVCDNCEEPNCDCTCCKNCGQNEYNCECCSYCGNNCTCCCSCNNECPECGEIGYDGSCDSCGHGNYDDEDYDGEGEIPPGSSIFQLALRLGLKPDRPIIQHIADTYLLENLWKVQGHKQAGKVLTKMAAELAPELATYLDIACGGELRHGSYYDLGDIEEPPVINYSSRTVAWENWIDWKSPKYRADYARRVFWSGWQKETNEHTGIPGYRSKGYIRLTDSPGAFTGGGYGGPAWGMIADVLDLYIQKKLSKVAFLDRVWNLQHNGGCALNKVYNETMTRQSTINKVLSAHGQDDYETLYTYASDETKAMWDGWQFAHECGHADYLQNIANVGKFGGEGSDIAAAMARNDSDHRWGKLRSYSGSLRGQLKWQAHFTSE